MKFFSFQRQKKVDKSTSSEEKKIDDEIEKISNVKSFFKYFFATEKLYGCKENQMGHFDTITYNQRTLDTVSLN